MTHLPNVGLMLGHRLRRWSSFELALGERSRVSQVIIFSTGIESV